MLFYGETDESLINTATIKATTTYKTNEEVINEKESGESRINITDNTFADKLKIQFIDPVTICELIIAGLDRDDYNCTKGFQKTSKKTCEKCDIGKFSESDGDDCKQCGKHKMSTDDRTGCTPCNYLTYTDVNDWCYQCTRVTSRPRCYETEGDMTLNLINSINSDTSINKLQSFSINDSPKSYNSPSTVDIKSGSFYIDTVVMVVEKDKKLAIKVEDGSCNKKSELTPNDELPLQIVFKCKLKVPMTTFTIFAEDAFDLYKIFAFGVPFAEANVEPGEFANGTSRKIELCPPGSYSTGGSRSECKNCLENQYQSKPGSATCLNCDKGFFSDENMQSCIECEKDPTFKTCRDEKLNCGKEDERNDVYGKEKYVWPSTPSNTTSELPCQFNNSKVAKKKCVTSRNRAQYDKTDFSACPTAVTEDIKKISEKTVTKESQLEISEQIKNIAVDKGDIMNNDNVKETATILDNLIELPDIQKKVQENIVKTVNGINSQTKDEELTEGETAFKLTNSMKSLADNIASKKETDFIPESTVGLAVITPVQAKTTKVVIRGSDELNFKNSTLNGVGEYTILDAEVPNKNETPITAIIYSTDKLHPSNEISNDLFSDFKELAFSTSVSRKKEIKRIATIIADISYKDENDRVDLTDKLEMKYNVKEPNITTHYKMHYTYTTKCTYYNTSEKTWRTDGCATEEHTENGIKKVKCSCTHMTSFAVMLSFSSDYHVSEDYASHILLAISLGCLICTIIAYLPAKDLLKKRTVRLNLLLATSLIFAIVTFYFMEVIVTSSMQGETNPPEVSISCLVVAFFMNYFWLCQIAWMVTEAVVMYIMLVSRVENSHISRYMLKFNTACWGIPLIFPVVGVSIGGTKFANPFTCFLNLPYAYGTFYAPVVIGILFNIFIFIRVWWSVNYNKNQMGTKVPQSDLERRKKQLKFAVTVMTLLGTAWIFGFFLIIKKFNMIWLRWIFIILNSTQGIWIFILYVIMNESLRKVWLQLIGSSTPSSHSTVPYSRSKGGFSNAKTKETTDKTRTDTLPLASASNEYKNTNIDSDGVHIYEVISNPDVCFKHSKRNEPPIL